jgi:hypothetical protein
VGSEMCIRDSEYTQCTLYGGGRLISYAALTSGVECARTIFSDRADECRFVGALVSKAANLFQRIAKLA